MLLALNECPQGALNIAQGTHNSSIVRAPSNSQIFHTYFSPITPPFQPSPPHTHSAMPLILITAGKELRGTGLPTSVSSLWLHLPHFKNGLCPHSALTLHLCTGPHGLLAEPRTLPLLLTPSLPRYPLLLFSRLFPQAHRLAGISPMWKTESKQKQQNTSLDHTLPFSPFFLFLFGRKFLKNFFTQHQRKPSKLQIKLCHT